MESIRVRPWEVREGDRILGTSMVANGPAQYAGYLYADTIDQQCYTLAVTRGDGRVGQIPCWATSWVEVLREDVSVEQPPGTVATKITYPIVCHACDRRFSVGRVTAGLRCVCGSNDLDL